MYSCNVIYLKRLISILSIFDRSEILRFFLLKTQATSPFGNQIVRIATYPVTKRFRDSIKFKKISRANHSFFISKTAMSLLFRKIGFSACLLETSKGLVLIRSRNEAAAGGRFLGILFE